MATKGLTTFSGQPVTTTTTPKKKKGTLVDYAGRPVTTTPKKTTASGGTPTQMESTNAQLVSRGPAYGSQSARVNGTGTPVEAIMPQQSTPQAISGSDAQRSSGTGGVSSSGGVPNGGVAGFNQGTTDPITGAIAGYGYTPQGLGMLYDNPEILANDLLAKLGIANPGMGTSLGQYMEPAATAQFLTNQGVGSSASDSETMNYILKYMQEMVTPNGRTPEFDYLVNQLLGGNGDPAGNNLLATYLQIDPSTGLARTPENQIKVANAMFGQTLVGLNPYAQNAYSGYAGAQGNNYLAGIAKGQPGGSSYADYLAKSGLSGLVNR